MEGKLLPYLIRQLKPPSPPEFFFFLFKLQTHYGKNVCYATLGERVFEMDGLNMYVFVCVCVCVCVCVFVYVCACVYISYIINKVTNTEIKRICIGIN